uniref:AP20 region protein 1 n=1 Tax=Saimiri boliviensis boliviensis TaxID=39432 RepID=A0A2K6U7B1_SAIBB
MKTMATRERCKLSRTGPGFGNVIKTLLCARTFHTRIGGDLTHGIINRGRLANVEQMGLQGSAQHFNVFPLGPLDSRPGTANQPSIAARGCLFSRGITASVGMKRGRAQQVRRDAWKKELGGPWVSTAPHWLGWASPILELSWFLG